MACCRVGSEIFGKKTRRQGRDHGVTADERPCRTIKDPVTITDLHATNYDALGIPPNHGYDVEKRPCYVTNDGKGRAVRSLLA